MTTFYQQRYFQLRKKYPTMSATSAYREARQEKRHHAIDWEEGRDGKHATLTIDGFTVTLTVEPDYDHDWLDCRGTFSSTWEEGAIRNPESRYDRHVYEWFIPETTEEEEYRDLRKMKYGKAEARALARSYAQQNLAIARDPEGAVYWAAYVHATASKEGVTLGEGGIGGIELDYSDDDTYIDECAYDVAHEAVSEAKAALARLQNAI